MSLEGCRTWILESKPMNESDHIRAIENILVRQLGWIAAADSKVSFVFTIITAMLGVLAAVSPRGGAPWSTAPALFALLAAACGLLSLIALSLVTFPRTKNINKSVIYFGKIAESDAAIFHDAILNMTYESYIIDLSDQCYRNAEIASRKFKWLQRALILLYLAIVPWSIAVFLLFSAR